MENFLNPGKINTKLHFTFPLFLQRTLLIVYTTISDVVNNLLTEGQKDRQLDTQSLGQTLPATCGRFLNARI